MNIFDKLPKAAPRSQIYKEHLFAIADFILVISEKARREGILALEADVNNDDSYPSFFSSMEKFFFKHLATLMVDGTSQENIESFAKYYIATIDENDPELLFLMIEAEGVLAIQRGENPYYMIRYLLASMMGPELCREYLEKTIDDEPAEYEAFDYEEAEESGEDLNRKGFDRLSKLFFRRIENCFLFQNFEMTDWWKNKSEEPSGEKQICLSDEQMKDIAFTLIYLPEYRRRECLAEVPDNVRPAVEKYLAGIKDKKRTDKDVMEHVRKATDFGFLGASYLRDAKEAQFKILHTLNDFFKIEDEPEQAADRKESEDLVEANPRKNLRKALVENFVFNGELNELALVLSARCSQHEAEFSFEKEFMKLSEEEWLYINLHGDELYEENPIILDVMGYVSFEHTIQLLGDREIQKILLEIDKKTLMDALKKSSAETQKKFLRNMSKGATLMLHDDMQVLGEVSLEDIIAAQRSIISVINRLHDSGEIGFLGEYDEEYDAEQFEE